MKQLKMLNSKVLPVQYPDKFYKDLLILPHLHKFAFYNDIFVGAICTRLERDKETNVMKLYIMTLAVLEPYRRLGIGSKLLQYILDYPQTEDGKKIDIKEIFLHVQTTNQDAISFYQKFGFEIQKERKGYYRLESPDAFFLTKKVQ